MIVESVELVVTLPGGLRVSAIRHLKLTSDPIGRLGTGKRQSSFFTAKVENSYLYAICPIRPALVDDVLRFRQADL